MDKVILSAGPIKVSIERNSHDASLVMDHGQELRFLLSRGVLTAVVNGETVQFSHRGIFCKLAREDDQVNATYAWNGVPELATCDVRDLELLLSSIGNK